MMRWCRPTRAGDMFVPFGARRRRSFLREGPNGRDPSGGRDLIATDLLVAIGSRRSWASRPGRDGYGRHDRRLLPLLGTPILGRLRGRYRGDECARVGSPAGGLRSSGENGGLDGDVESFAELYLLGMGHRGQLEFYPVQAEFPPSVFTSRVVVTTSSCTEFLTVSAERASGGGDGAVVGVPVASSGSPVLVYVTLGPFRVFGSVGGNHENQVFGMGRGSGSRVVTVRDRPSTFGTIYE
ncbi:hypothetical protein Taro_022354 [Colocasia esculenta]|uniref:Uncharacterized protein n=1 Tax=Colocasia esculenta TaxID=4460 RepID=A0A843V3M5_COLES|nr:hypothetical protein [Colocasia esculenta]